MPTSYEFCSPGSSQLFRIKGVRIEFQYGQPVNDIILSCPPPHRTEKEELEEHEEHEEQEDDDDVIPPVLYVMDSTLGKTMPTSYDLLLPSLAHPHIHLDKAFLLSHPNYYPEYRIRNGDFQEAFEKTTEAKRKYTTDDLLERGRWVISESVAAGVTAIRAFVEVDVAVGLKCVDAAVRLKREFKASCHVQICAYAQDPLFTTEHGEGNRRLVKEAVTSRPEVEVLGTTPYVETDEEGAKRNVDWAIRLAMDSRKMLDFHTDYGLDDGPPTTTTTTTTATTTRKEVLVKYIVRRLTEMRWTSEQAPDKQNVLLGHGTRLTQFTDREWREIADEMSRAGLKRKITFVGLPSSDTYMQGRPPPRKSGGGHATSEEEEEEEQENERKKEEKEEKEAVTGSRPRATLMVPQLIKDYGLNAIVGVNNIGNMYTPQGSCDPLALISSCVGLYQAGTMEDAKLLYACVSTKAKEAMGLPTSDLTLGILADSPPDWIVVPGAPSVESAATVAAAGGGGAGALQHEHEYEYERYGDDDEEEEERRKIDSVLGVPRRPRLRIFDVVLDPPPVHQRKVVYKGRLVK